MQFLQQDLRPVPAPSEGDLRRYYAAHTARYGTAERVGFSHVFFSADRGGDAAAKARAQAALGQLGAGVLRAPERGDAFPDSYDFSGLDHEQAQRLFGKTELSQALFSAPVGQWAGPYRSGFGWHLVRVDDHEAGRAKPFGEVRGQVETDVRDDARERENLAGFAALKRRYSIVRRDRG
jgi:peptidyl-prolyl cis-trans isomerase C